MFLSDQVHAFWRSRAGRALFDWFAVWGPWLQVALLLLSLPFELVAEGYRNRRRA